MCGFMSEMFHTAAKCVLDRREIYATGNGGTKYNLV